MSSQAHLLVLEAFLPRQVLLGRDWTMGPENALGGTRNRARLPDFWWHRVAPPGICGRRLGTSRRLLSALRFSAILSVTGVEVLI